jgi:hypothetical protein
MAFDSAFSSEVDTGSHQENAQKQKNWSPDPMGSEKAPARGACWRNRGSAAWRFFRPTGV